MTIASRGLIIPPMGPPSSYWSALMVLQCRYAHHGTAMPVSSPNIVVLLGVGLMLRHSSAGSTHPFVRGRSAVCGPEVKM